MTQFILNDLDDEYDPNRKCTYPPVDLPVAGQSANDESENEAKVSVISCLPKTSFRSFVNIKYSIILRAAYM